ncbi:hypothetical protein OH77DRAFT_592250 [Trametes cingulata]|nr:hypothetical protein OH77DRAFT_592250 [Trametes cingulata]
MRPPPPCICHDMKQHNALSVLYRHTWAACVRRCSDHLGRLLHPAVARIEPMAHQRTAMDPMTRTSAPASQTRSQQRQSPPEIFAQSPQVTVHTAARSISDTSDSSLEQTHEHRHVVEYAQIA